MTAEKEKCAELLRGGGAVEYQSAVAAMEARVGEVLDGTAPELLWLLEHPPLYTAGTGAKAGELLQARFPVHRSGRGGRYTYHGPGQRVAYVVLDLRSRGRDLRRFVGALESWVGSALAELGVEASPRAGRIGLWVVRDDGREEKIAAVGVRVRRWVAFHGVSVNLDPDLSHFEGIVPCGLADYGVTSLRALNCKATMAELDAALVRGFEATFSTRLLSVSDEAT